MKLNIEIGELMIKFLIIGISLVLVRNIDFGEGAFLLHSSSKEWRNIVIIVSLIIWTVVASLRLKREQYLRLFFWFNLFYMLDHAVWFNMMQYFYSVSSIPINQSLPYFEEAWQNYVRMFGARTIFIHYLDFFLVYIFFIIVAKIADAARIVWNAMMEELRKG